MKKSTITKACLAVATAGAMVFLGATSASATSPTTADAAAFEEFYDRYGVDEVTQNDLLEQLAAGEILDSMTSGAEPVTTYERDSAEQTEYVSVFEDGSISVTGFEKPVEEVNEGGVGTRAVSDCTSYSGGGYASYANCLVSNGNGTMSLQFRADYSRWASGASISNARDAQVVAHYGTATAPTLTTVRANATPQQEAVVTMYSRFTSWNGLSSEDLYLSLRVNATQAWTTTY
ncbi:hypothetical protein SK224_04935 [Microbacterium sp. BG28]|uniref:hypothetical protein n=1 Tax=Microbacterium sp. BG28 TaxID=3097356 RepID=UPI002A5A39E6|nr:hypothetical protein [Microbacterium sp. BG28]MDY0828468.1 hypothetical protein [Microbacterium sp. BG28]